MIRKRLAPRVSGVYRPRRIRDRAELPVAPDFPFRAVVSSRTCQHTVIYLAPIAEWQAWPVWRCAGCRAVVGDCTHAEQVHTSSGWLCAGCRRTLLPLAPTG